MKSTKVILAISIVVLQIVSMSCTLSKDANSAEPLSKEQALSIQNALDSLNKLKAGTEVGVNYANYKSALIEAKAKVNKTQTFKETDNLNLALTDSMTAYVDAGIVWQSKIGEGYFGCLTAQSSVGGAISSRHKGFPTLFDLGPYVAPTDCDKVMSIIWADAAKFVECADFLFLEAQGAERARQDRSDCSKELPSNAKFDDAADSQKQKSLKSSIKFENGTLRMLPSQDSEILSTLKQGDAIIVIKRKSAESAWYNVRTKEGVEGWIHGNEIHPPS